MLFHNTTQAYYFQNPLILLDSSSRLSFKRSFLRYPTPKKIVFGDKEVIHWKMEGSVTPKFDSTLPIDWSFSLKEPEYLWYTSPLRALYREYAWSGGDTFAWSEGICYEAGRFDRSKPYTVYSAWRREAKLLGDKMYLREAGKSNYDDDWEFNEWRLNAVKDSLGAWHFVETGTVFNQRDVTFEVVNSGPPHYWIDYMTEIRPYKPNDTAALSECIRNSITENTTLNTNNYANASEIIGLVNDIRKGEFVDLIENSKSLYKDVKTSLSTIGKRMPSGKNLRTLAKSSSKRAANAWLKYRYAYNTTKSDIEQYVEAMSNDYLGSLTPERVLRGNIDITAGTLRVKMRLHDKSGPNFTKTLINLNQHGLLPGLYNTWDMIPFSFIADWFSNLGDYLQDIDESIYFDYYEVDELLVSRKQTITVDEVWGLTTYSWYERELLDEMPQWEIYEEENTSSKVLIYRTLDAASIGVGVS